MMVAQFVNRIFSREIVDVGAIERHRSRASFAWLVLGDMADGLAIDCRCGGQFRL